MDINGKVALVTGAATGIGLTYVKELLKNGVKGVLMTDTDAATAEKELQELRQQFGDAKISFLVVDVCNKEQLEQAFKTVIKIYNQLDIVINNAGIVNEVNWDQCCRTNLIGTISGTMLAMNEYLPKYKSSDDAVIVNTSSTLGLEPLESIPVYTATKFGVLGFTRAMGSEFWYDVNKIRVIGICPGRTITAIKQFSTRQISEPCFTKFMDFFNASYNQPAISVAKHVMNLIRTAPSGSIWKMINDECEQVDFPTYVIS